MFENFKRSGSTIIFVTNNVDEILLSDKVMILENKKIKYIFNKCEILDNINLLEDSGIKIPDIIQIILKLKQKGIDINLKEWTITEMIDAIVKVYKK